MISRVEFNGSDCSGTMDVSSYDLTGGPAFTDDGDWYFTCTCVPEVPGQTEYIIESAQYSDSNCTVPCDDTNGCNKDDYALVAGTDTQSLGSCVQYRVHSDGAMFDIYIADDMDCNDATRFYSSMQVNWLSGYCESQEDGAYRKYTIKDNYNRLPTATPTVAPSGPSMAPVVTPSPSAAPTPYSAKRCSDAQTRSIVMGADAYFNDSSAWMHYYPADTCVGEEDDTVYRCSDDGYVLYRYRRRAAAARPVCRC